jgi:hypothetical protein
VHHILLDTTLWSPAAVSRRGLRGLWENRGRPEGHQFRVGTNGGTENWREFGGAVDPVMLPEAGRWDWLAARRRW